MNANIEKFRPKDQSSKERVAKLAPLIGKQPCELSYVDVIAAQVIERMIQEGKDQREIDKMLIHLGYKTGQPFPKDKECSDTHSS